MKKKIIKWLLKQLCDGHLPVDPSKAIWELIDKENQKPEEEIRCDYIEAWKRQQTVLNVTSDFQ